MIYDLIVKNLSDFLIDKGILQLDEILIEDEIVSPNNVFFCRFTWNFGSSSAFTNNDYVDTANLSLEFYERKNIQYNNVFDITIQALKQIKKNIITIKDVEDKKVAVLNNILTRKNVNDQSWNSYILTLNFQIFG